MGKRVIRLVKIMIKIRFLYSIQHAQHNRNKARKGKIFELSTLSTFVEE